jgi:hypothetical protein
MDTTRDVILGEGVLNWQREERICNRYGAVHLETRAGSDTFAAFRNIPAGQPGVLVARILENGEPGFMAVGRELPLPEPGTVVMLGMGVLFRESPDGIPSVGVEPQDGRRENWMDPDTLAVVHQQVVRLEFRPAAETGERS